MNETRVVRTKDELSSAVKEKAQRILIKGELAETVNKSLGIADFWVPGMALAVTLGVLILGFLRRMALPKPLSGQEINVVEAVAAVGRALAQDISKDYARIRFTVKHGDIEAELLLERREGDQGKKQTVDQAPATEGESEIPSKEDSSAMIKILFLAANPTDTVRLRLDKEIRSIDQALRQSDHRDRFDVEQHWAVQATDLQSLLLRHTPDIVHFSGHGSRSNKIILEDEAGKRRPVSARALERLFSVLRDNIKCVVLNACYSEQQARAIAKHIPCVVGMSKAIGDSAAISFSAAFYQALGFGRDVKTAFDLGCVQIDLEGLEEQDIPVLLADIQDPNETVFVRAD